MLCQHPAGSLGFLGHKPPASLQGPEISLSLLQMLIFPFAWPHSCVGTQTCVNTRNLSLAPPQKVFSNELHIKKQRHYFANKGPSSQGYGFSTSHVWMWKLDKESWMLKKWCFWTVVFQKTLESPLDCKEIQPVHPKGDQSWVFIGRTDVEAETPVLWPPDVESWLIGKDPDAGKV